MPKKKMTSPAHSKKVKFVAFSDIQIEDWKQHSTDHSRLYDNKKILKLIKEACQKHDVPALFCGDLFDNNKAISNLVMSTAFGWIKNFTKGVPIMAIHGNHDQSEQNSLTHASPNYIRTLSTLFKNFNDVSLTYLEYGEFIIAGIPYLTGNAGFEEAVKRLEKKVSKSPKRKILLIHTDLPGAVDSNGFEVNESNLPKNLTKLFKTFDLVLCGHIHKPQIIRRNILMLGATHQQRVTDSGTKMGYWLIYEDLTYKFVRLPSPRFIYVGAKEEIPDDKNFYIQEKAPHEQAVLDRESFVTRDPAKLATKYLKVKKIKSKAKKKLLIKYLASL